MQQPKERHVKINKHYKLLYLLILFIVTLFLFSCIGGKNMTDVSLLKVYFSDYRKENKKDSIFLGLDYSNLKVFKTYERYMKSENKEFKFPENQIFLEKEYNNFKNQVVESGNWNLDLDNFKNVYLREDYPNKNDFLYVSKPIYTIDKKYSLIYRYIKGLEGEAYFINSIEVYKKLDNSWIKISKISHF